MKLEQLGLQIDSPLAHMVARNFRPPSWPPPPDWSPIRDANRVAQCVFSDSVWPLDVWAGKPLKLNFGDGKTRGARTDKPNGDILRQCAAWFLFGYQGCRNAHSLKYKITVIKPIFVTCTEEGIVATDLMRFPRVLDKVARALAPSSFDFAVTVLHELLDARDDLGFCLLDKDGLARLAALAPEHHEEQTPYIPPRIWSYQVSRIRECLTEYLAHREQVAACFAFCLDVHATNYGSLKRAVNAKADGSRSPFQVRDRNRRKGCHFHGAFKLTADRFAENHGRQVIGEGVDDAMLNQVAVLVFINDDSRIGSAQSRGKVAGLQKAQSGISNRGIVVARVADFKDKRVDGATHREHRDEAHDKTVNRRHSKGR